jgi:sterol desaturase/sphingolipid hydroxylase (fatty acid hydroxylase superfamily)
LVKSAPNGGALRQAGDLLLLVCLFVGLAWVGAVSMVFAHRMWAGEPFGWEILTAIPTSYTDLAILPIMVTLLLIDRLVHGPDQFALGRLFGRVRYDLFFVLTYATGATWALQLAFSFGLANWLVSLFSPVAVFRPIGEMPFWAQIPVIYIVGTFGVYWGHRFMHTRLMWPLHAMHHAATDMTALTDVRAHPLDDAIGTIPVYVSFALLGFAPDAVLIVGLIARVHFALTHSSVPFPLWLERWVITGPRVHRVHHAAQEEYLNRNFSLLVVWDRLFGTYSLPPDARLLATGVADPRFSTGRPWHDMFAVTGIWIAGLQEDGSRYVTSMGWRGRPKPVGAARRRRAPNSSGDRSRASQSAVLARRPRAAV